MAPATTENRVTLKIMDMGAVAGMTIGFGLLVVVPVVAIMTEHQRKMARILHGLVETEKDDKSQIVIGVHASGLGKKSNAGSDNEVVAQLRAMRNELADLRIQVASLQSPTVPPPAPVESVRERLSQGA